MQEQLNRQNGASLARARQSLRGWGSRPHTSHANPDVTSLVMVLSMPEACPRTVARLFQADEECESTDVPDEVSTA
jgi:hypothetical protein